MPGAKSGRSVVVPTAAVEDPGRIATPDSFPETTDSTGISTRTSLLRDTLTSATCTAIQLSTGQSPQRQQTGQHQHTDDDLFRSPAQVCGLGHKHCDNEKKNGHYNRNISGARIASTLDRDLRGRERCPGEG